MCTSNDMCATYCAFITSCEFFSLIVSVVWYVLGYGSVSPVSPLDNIFALPVKVFLLCLAIVSAVMVGGLFLWPALLNSTQLYCDTAEQLDC